MEDKQSNGAVLYVRVSTEEQAIGPLNLINQEKRCRDYCQQHGLTIAAVFTDPGESARSANRPEFQRMLRFCKTNRRIVRYVVVQDLSRFARDVLGQLQTIKDLKANGVLLRSTYENNIDETAQGMLAANILGTFNQYFSDALSEKQRDRTRQGARAGRFLWRAPLGYKNIRGKEGARIEIDEERAPLIRQAFQLFATNQHSTQEVLGMISHFGLTALTGRPLAKQSFHCIFRNPVYAGWIALRSDPSFQPVRGLHDAIVDQSTFDQVQAILAGRKPPQVEKKKFNPLLPLKHFVKCGACGTPLTGAACKGRVKKYLRYWCRKPGCRAVSLSSVQLESEFIAVLRRLKLSDDTVSAFPKVAARVWAAKQGNDEREMAALKRRLEDQKRQKAELLRMRTRSELSREEFEAANADFSTELQVTEESLHAATLGRQSANSFIRFAELQVMDIAHSWLIAKPEQRLRVQNLLFEGGLEYLPEAGISNRCKSALFNTLEMMNVKNDEMVGTTGFEPATSTVSR